MKLKKFLIPLTVMSIAMPAVSGSICVSGETLKDTQTAVSEKDSSAGAAETEAADTVKTETGGRIRIRLSRQRVHLQVC